MTNEKAILWIMNVKGVTNKKMLKMLECYKTPLNIINGDKQLLMEQCALDEATCDAILHYDDVDRLINRLYKYNVKFFTYLDDVYPENFRNISSPPILIYYKGEIPQRYDRYLSVVGSRNCSVYGAEASFRICKELAENKMVIVSGMARGIDTMAHKGALAGGGQTIAIVGSGLDKCYPAENRNLMDEIIKNGCVMSEFPVTTPPHAYNFPIRNRLIAAVSRGTLVVEAGRKSGTFITVSEALESGRDIFAIPGNINTSLSEGTNALIKSGAYAVTNANDIIYAYYRAIGYKDLVYEKNIYDQFRPEERVVYDCINLTPKTVKDVSEHTGLQAHVCQYIVALMEINGHIKKLPGNLYVKI